MNKKNLIIFLSLWSLIISFSLSWNIYFIKENNQKLILNKSKLFFQQILITRLWNSNHNGVYVLVTPENQPNEYLIDSIRDIVSRDGMQLTKRNIDEW